MEHAIAVLTSPIFVGFLLLWVARFENQRWVRARAAGIRGASQAAGLFVDLTGLFAFLSGVALLVWLTFKTSLLDGVTIFLGSVAAGTLYGIVSSLVYRDQIVVWLVATLAIYPLVGFLTFSIASL